MELTLEGVAKELIANTPEGYSNTVELYDAVLKFFPRRIVDTPNPHEWTVRFKNRDYQATITPAIIRKGRKTLFALPSSREDLVEKTLRKMAAESLESVSVTRNLTGHYEVTVNFNLQDIANRLAAGGHSFNSREIDEAIRILAGVSLEVKSDTDTTSSGMTGPIIQGYAYARKKAGRTGKFEESRGWVKLHPLVTASLLEGTYRRINYNTQISLGVDLARWLYSRMSHNFTQASYSLSNGYHIGLDTILRESGISEDPQISRNIRKVRKALQELKDREVILSFDEEKKYPQINRGGSRVRIPPINVVWTLYPSMQVVGDTIAENTARRKKGLALDVDSKIHE